MIKQLSNILLILLGATLFAAATGWASAYFYLAIKDKTEATADLLAKSSELSGKESHLVSLVLALKKDYANIEKLNGYVIKENEIVSFAKTLEDLGPQSGTAVKIEALDKGLTEKAVPYLNLRISAIGSFENVFRLMVLLENFPGKFEWRSTRLGRESLSDKQKGAPQWSLGVSFSALNFVR